MLEALQPPVNAESDWLDVRRAVSLDERATLVPADRQAELFDQHKAEVVAATRLLRAQDASGEGVGGDPEAGGSTVIARALQGEEVNAEGEEEATALRSLRDEQVRSTSAAYERLFYASVRAMWMIKRASCCASSDVCARRRCAALALTFMTSSGLQLACNCAAARMPPPRTRSTWHVNACR